MKRNLVYIGNHLRSSTKNPTYSLSLIERLKQEGYTVVASSSKNNKILRLLDMWMTLRKNRKAADYVLIDTYSTWNYYFAIIIAWWARKWKLRYIPILHGGDLPNRLKKSPKSMKRYLDGAHIVVSPSSYLAEVFENFGLKSSVIIRNAIELDLFPFKAKQAASGRILWLRAFLPIYNPELAIRAFKRLKEQLPKVSLTMAGPGDEAVRAQCMALAKSEEVEVEFLGKQTREQWVALANAHDVYMSTTNADNVPLSVIEAMAMGLPVVSTDVGGMPFLIANEKDGLLVPANDEVKMEEAIKKLLTDTQLSRALAESARSKVEDYDWQLVIDKWKAVLI